MTVKTPLTWAKWGLISLFVCIVVYLLIITLSILSLDHVKPSGLLPVPATQRLVINNINIVRPDLNTTHNNQRVTIENGIITDISEASNTLEPDGLYLDGRGQYLTPGLMDMHVHIHHRKHLMLTLAYGVTTVRNLRGLPMHLRWKKELINKQWLGSDIYTSSPVLAGPQTHLFNQLVATPEAGMKQVKSAVANGYDSIKVYGDLTSDVFEAIITTARQMHIPIVKHGPHPVTGSEWDTIKNIQSLEHIEDIFQGIFMHRFLEEKLDTIAKQLKQLNTPIVPTLEAFNHLTQMSLHKQDYIDTLPLKYLNPFYREIENTYTIPRWLSASKAHANYNAREMKFLMKVLKALDDNNVTLLLGSDVGVLYTIAGLATHNEMALMQQAGLNNAKILVSATLNPSQALGIADKKGTIEVGKDADLILSQHNPLTHLSTLKAPVAVIKNGYLMDQATLQKMKQSAEDQSFYWTLINVLEDLLHRNIIN